MSPIMSEYDNRLFDWLLEGDVSIQYQVRARSKERIRMTVLSIIMGFYNRLPE